MSDNYRNDDKKANQTDDEFFAKFDDMADAKKGSANSDQAEGDDFFYGSSKDYRGKSNVKATRTSRNSKNRGGRSKKSRQTAKSLKNKSAAMASKAASSKFGQKVAAKTLKPETKAGKIIGTIVLIGTICVLAVGVLVGVIFLKAPAINTDDIYSQINQRSVMYDTKGKEIENLYFSDGNRSIIQYKDIPQNMVNAVIAIEDQKFWSHHGFNYIRLIGAVKDGVLGGGQISGTSTVSQQLARNVYLSEIKSERSFGRKISEMYCTIVLEKDLTKEQIMEAYLNTIYLGFNSYGVETAAQSYFSKSAKDLDLLECASLAALPQSPDTYALVYSDYYNTNTSLPVIKKSQSVTYLYNGDLSKSRRDLVLKNMADKGFITADERDDALAKDLKDEIKIGSASDASNSSYFTDYALEQLVDDIVDEYGVSEADAREMIYTKGLKIYTTMDSKIQNIMEDEFDDSSNFTSIAYANTNADGDIVGESGQILARSYSNYFNSKDQFVLKSGDYKMHDDGSMTLKSGKRLNFYNIEVDGAPDVSVEFKGMYTKNSEGIFYFIESGALSIPQGYKTMDEDGDCTISAAFFKDYPEFFKKSGSDYLVSDENYSLKQKIRQPQAAAVIMENSTGEIKGMMGGRGATGKQLFNRAVNPRQPGSSIKPIAMYGPAIQMGYEYEKEGKTMNLDKSDGSDWGKYTTAGSVINDAVTHDGNGKVWPKNDDLSYHGDVTMRRALQLSLNVCSYKIYKQIERNEGAEYSMDMLKKVGITTLDDENDLNPAALSLGGLTNGLTPLEETAAYATFPNGGVYKTPIFYTEVRDNKDQLLIKKETEETQVYNKGVAWIMTNMLRSVVTDGIAGGASISTQPVGGKTGTTSNKYDIWFSGFTPQYTMSLWMGNDINISVSDYSYKSAYFWSNIMGRVCADLPREDFFDRPSNVKQYGSEYYIDGTYSKTSKRNHGDKDKTSNNGTTAPTSNTSPTSDTSGGGGGTDPTSPPTTPPTKPTSAPTSPPDDPEDPANQ